jgi:hypothetical protein
MRRNRLVREWLSRQAINVVSVVEWRALLADTGLTETALRRVLRDLKVPVEPPYCGVRQTTLEELEASLIELEQVYHQGSPELQRYCRRVVIEAKDHARLASRHPRHRALKEEMVRWMLVWLENPEVFETWARLRRQQLTSARDLSP